MANNETSQVMVNLITERAKEIAHDAKIQNIMLKKLADGESKEAVKNWVYTVAIATLYGSN